MILLRYARPAALLCALLAPAPALAWEGKVSFYGQESGHRTANGERFTGLCTPRRPVPCGCAHWTLPMGTVLQVTDLATGHSILCRVNDRGPHPRLHRSVDLVHETAVRLGIVGRGVIRARITVVFTRGAGRLHLAAQ